MTVNPMIRPWQTRPSVLTRRAGVAEHDSGALRLGDDFGELRFGKYGAFHGNFRFQRIQALLVLRQL